MSSTGLSKDLNKNISILKAEFLDCSDVVFRPLNVEGLHAVLVFVEGLVDTKDIQEHVLHELVSHTGIKNNQAITLTMLEEKVMSIADVNKKTTSAEVIAAILDGNTVLFIDKVDRALIFGAKGAKFRGISEPETEASIRGPREGFIESIGVNTSLLRRKIRSSDLKVVSKKLGEKTQTNIAIVYMDGLINEDVLTELYQRIDRIKIDAVLESGYIESYIEDNPWSIFPQVQISERPDTVAANLLEGRAAILIDGTPFSIVVPSTFWQLLQASEDYYERFYYTTFLRWIRLFFLIIALLLPSMYVAITTYHQEMIPTNLLLSLAASREAIPFPAFVEAMIMELSFEALREAGVRLPKIIGQAVSILGALVIGTAAVEAGIVSAPMVIVVSLTGIASFTIPKFNMAIAIRLLRFPLMILGGIFGLFGIVVGVMILSAHLCKLRSFGVPYFSPVAPLSFSGLKDVLIRVPLWAQDYRPKQFVKRNRKRQRSNLMPSPDKGKR